MTVHPTPIRRLSEDFAVASQLGPMDFAVLKARGYRTVINNRPDAEAGAKHMQASDAEELARAHGLDYVHLPVTGLDVTDEDVAKAFRTLLETREGPVLAHCATGTRSAILWAFAETQDQSVDRVVAQAAAAGFDLEIVRDDLEERAASPSFPPGTVMEKVICKGADRALAG